MPLSFIENVVNSMHLNFGEESVEKVEDKAQELSAQSDPEKNSSKRQQPGTLIDKRDLKVRYRFALDPKLAGASKIHGPALIYRNDRFGHSSYIY